MEFQYYLPVNLQFGPGKLRLLGEETSKYGKKALLVTGKHSTKASGVLDRAIAYLSEAGVDVVIFDRVLQNPTSEIAKEGCDIVLQEKCDVFDYIFGVLVGKSSMPIVLVPTTCGTGSEGNCFAVLTNPENQDKKSLRSMENIAKVSIIDPELMTTMSPSLMATVGYDALCHNIEAYLSKRTQPLVQMQALYAIEMIVEVLPRLYHGQGTMEDYCKMSLASTLGGMVINMAGVIAPHALEHPASGLRDIAHGKGLAALSPYIYELTIETSPSEFTVLAKTFGGQTKEDFMPAYLRFMKEIDMMITLQDLGIQKEDIPWMVENCLKVSMPGLMTHPRLFTETAIRDIYEYAYSSVAI